MKKAVKLKKEALRRTPNLADRFRQTKKEAVAVVAEAKSTTWDEFGFKEVLYNCLVTQEWSGWLCSGCT